MSANSAEISSPRGILYAQKLWRSGSPTDSDHFDFSIATDSDNNGAKIGQRIPWENNQRAQTSSHDPIWFLRGTICSEHAVLVPINNMHTICVFVGQIRPQHDSRLVVPLAALSKMTENCGWINLSCRQYEIGCPPAVGNVVNLRFCGCYSPT